MTNTIKNNKKNNKKNSKKNTRKNTKKTTRNNNKYKFKNMKGGSKNFCNLITEINYHGIQNIGNSCYMNSVIQMFWTIPELRYQILNYIEDTSVHPNTDIQTLLDKQKTVIVYLKKIFDFFKNNDNNVVYLDETNLINLRKFFIDNSNRSVEDKLNETETIRQQDAEEFFEIISIIFTPTYMPKKDIAYTGSYAEPLIDLNGKYTQTTLDICDFPLPQEILNNNDNLRKTPKIDNAYILQVEVKGNTLSDCINSFIFGERMESTNETDDNGNIKIKDNRIGNCLNATDEDLVIVKGVLKNKGPATRTIKISNFSNNLIIQVKRFKTKVPFTGIKNIASITPDKELKINDTNFKLKGCIVHLGSSAGGGHYVYVIFDDNGEPIKEISDSTVSLINNSYNGYLTNGYIYYYRKI